MVIQGTECTEILCGTQSTRVTQWVRLHFSRTWTGGILGGEPSSDLDNIIALASEVQSAAAVKVVDGLFKWLLYVYFFLASELVFSCVRLREAIS